jgi:hypothetical protein
VANFGIAKLLHHSKDDAEEALKYYHIVVKNDPNHY